MKITLNIINNAITNDTGSNMDRSSVFITVGEPVGVTVGGWEDNVVLKEGLYVGNVVLSST